MPVIRFPIAELERLGKVPRAKLPDLIRDMGASVEESAGEEWAVECFPNRPDLYSTEGLARAVRAYSGKQPGLRSYKVLPAKEQLRVEPSVRRVRPVMRAAVVTGLKFPHAAIQGIMELQEDLHWGIGARRRKASIGVHDKAQLVPPYTY
ncbi:MAG: hypothetical protein LC624_02275, partial [Halobacteriales archaeon]|nr:hypothetical protein [Halobacteriales archaeon]